MTDVCPYEVSTNWARLEPPELVPSTILAKDIKTLRQCCFIRPFYYHDLYCRSGVSLFTQTCLQSRHSCESLIIVLRSSFNLYRHLTVTKPQMIKDHHHHHHHHLFVHKTHTHWRQKTRQWNRTTRCTQYANC